MAGALPVAAALQGDVRINAGGAQFTDPAGQTWSADRCFLGGFVYSINRPISGTPAQTLFQTERSGNFSYRIPVAAGRFRVTLYFSEIFFNTPGKRVFSVHAEGKPVLAMLDIFRSAGADAAVEKTFEVETLDGALDLNFLPVFENPKLSAIAVVHLREGPPPVLGVTVPPEITSGPAPVEVALPGQVSGRAPGDPSFRSIWEQIDGPASAGIKDATAPSTAVQFTEPGVYRFRLSASCYGSSASGTSRIVVSGDTSGQSPVRIRCGGPSYMDSSGKNWVADQFFQGGSTFSQTGAIQGTQDPDLFLCERFGNFGYNIPVRNGLYAVRIHVAEIFFKTAGARVFNVTAEGTPFCPAVDIILQSGFRTAAVISSLVRVKDSVLNLKFLPATQNPKVSAIEVVPILLDPAPLQIDAGTDAVLQFPKDSTVLISRILSSPTGGQAPAFRWAQTAGPEPAILETPSAPTTAVQFPGAGSYRFRIQMSQGSQLASAEVGVLVLGEVLPPFGVQTSATSPVGPVPASAQLTASVSGVPSGQAASWTGIWTQLEGPAAVPLSDRTSPLCKASFDVPGTYTFRFSASYNGATTASNLVVEARGDTAGQSPVRIRAGGGAYRDSLGNQWSGDAFFSGGGFFSVTTPVKGTADPSLYQSERFGAFSYRIPLRNGLYVLRLHFAELWFKNPSERVFGVNLGGKPLLSTLDLVKNAGPLNPWIWSGNVRVADGFLTLNFVPIKENPKVAALEILPLALDPPPLGVDLGGDLSLQLPADTLLLTARPTGAPAQSGDVACVWTQTAGPEEAHILNPTALASQVHFHSSGNYRFRATVTSGTASASADLSVRVLPVPDPPGLLRIRCGGTAYTDSTNRKWSADTYFGAGAAYSSTGSIAATADPALYLSERTGTAFSYKIPVENGEYTIRLHFAEIYWSQPQKRSFSVSLAGVPILKGLDICAAAGPRAALVREFVATTTSGWIDLAFNAHLDQAKISAIEVIPVSDPAHLLHVVIRSPEWVVDYSNAGFAAVSLSGAQSHTHGFGHALSRFQWREGANILSNQADLSLNASVGSHTYTLTIWDNDSPPGFLEDSVTLEVLPPSAVRGVIASYFHLAAAAVSGAHPSFVEVLPRFRIEAAAGSVGTSGMTSAAAVLRGVWTVEKSGKYSPVATPGVPGSVLIDGQSWDGPIFVEAGPHEIFWSIDRLTPAVAPLELTWRREDGATGAFAPVSHDQTAMRPQINRMPGKGPVLGGEFVEITGVGFFPKASTAVLWGGRRLTAEIFEMDPNRILLISPPGTGTVSVQVQTSQGTSNPMAYTYLSGTAPVAFLSKGIYSLPGPTQAAWGPDGRLYISSLTGAITVLEFDDQYNVVRSQIIAGVQNTPAYNAIGIGFSPWEPADRFSIYLAHARLFVTDGRSNVRPSPYLGQVSALASPLFLPTPLISGLPSTNHDHGINGMVFDNTGQIYVCVGGHTNAGIPNHNLGSLDESPFSAAVLAATVGKAGFDGAISYRDAKTGLPSMDQNDSRTVTSTGAPDVRLHATGLRNAFGIVFATNGRLYATDNGPNTGFGPASTTENTHIGDPVTPDKVVLLGKNHYYGHPNRSRGQFDARQNRYLSPWEAAAPEVATPALTLLPSSRNGIDEYRATAFGGGLRGALLVQEWNGALSALLLSADGRRVESTINQVWGAQRGLGVLCGPGGAILVVDYTGSQIIASLPDDKAVNGMIAYDIFPWRAPASGDFSFVIGGKQFGNLSNTTVTIGKQQARLTSVSSQRIKGVLPASANPTAAFLPVLVSSGGKTSVIPDGFRYLLGPGQGCGVWKEEAPLPVAPGETAAAEVGGLVYVLSEDSHVFQAFNPVTGAWSSNFPPPPVPVSNPCLGAVGTELILVGNVGVEAPWRVQIYTPYTRRWRQGAPGPWNSSKPGVAADGRSVYACGGQIAGASSPVAAVYEVDVDRWRVLPQMPLSCTEPAVLVRDASVWVFGNAAGAQSLGVQSLNLSAGTWSVASTQTAKAMPNRFGARAVYLGGEFYLIGGRTESGEALQCVDALLPQSLKWRSDADLTEASWGVGAVASESEIFILGGRNALGPLKSARLLTR